MLKDIATGLIYRNPKPHLRSVHAYFPSVVSLGGGEMLASMVLGEAFDSTNCTTHVARSSDSGATWQMQGRICPPGDYLASDACRLTALGGGEVVAFMIRADRSERPDDGLANPETLGFVPTELLLLRSGDNGRSWSAPAPIKPPLVGPSFEMCSPITPLADGRWLLPTSTWRSWDGHCPNGTKMVAFISRDRGRTWPQYATVMNDPQQHIIYWESKIVQLPGGRLVAVAWGYDEKNAKDLPNQYAFSDDGAATWSPPQSMGLSGQTLTPLALPDGRMLCIYRRVDKPGLWANLSHMQKDRWVNDAELPLWGHQASGLTGTSNNMADNFSVLRFGAPCIATLPDGTIFAAFWCYEDCVSNIRWFKFRLA